MDKDKIKKALEQLKKDSKKRNFTQSVDLVINLQNLDFKKPEEQVDVYVTLPHGKGKKAKVCALVGPELQDEASKVCDKVVGANEFDKYKQDPKITKKLASEYDFFIAQANIMAQVAGAFGKVLGSRKKMPNPK